MLGDWKVVLVVFSFCILGWRPSSINGDTDPNDAGVLRVMYSSLNSPNQLTQWSSTGGDPCGQSWKGVTCSGTQVTEIKLSGLGLSGSMGYILDSLKSLTNLDMSNNNLGGGIPYQLPPNLQQLNLAYNNFNGQLPYSISLMTSLNYLNVGHNQLQNQLPDMFGNGKLTSLTTMDLSFNSLSGDLPEGLSSLSSMSSLYLQNNQFTGTINVLANLPLENLNVQNNHFTGWIPQQLTGINLQKDGNSWSSGPAPPPPPGTPPASKTNPKHKSGGNNSPSDAGGGGNNSGIGGGGIAGIVISIFVNLSKQMVSLTGGLPLALEVFGSFLFERWRIEEWKDALHKLERIRPHNLQDVLKISYDGLDVQEQRIFLDIACLFIKMEMKREDILDALKGCGFRAEIAVTVLRARSLIKVFEDNSLWMHDQIRDMGRQIVLDESPVDPGTRSRLWDRDEIMTVLKDEKGTTCIEGIVLDFEGKPIVQDPSGERISRENLQRKPNFTSALTYAKEKYKKFLQDNAEKEREALLCTKPFESMVNLRLLQINNVRLEGKYKYLPAGLKWLQWKGCPLKALPSDFCPRELAVLDLSRSGIEKVWGSYTSKVAENLMVMNLSRCYNLAAIPDLSGNHALEKLILVGCKKLTKIHESLGNLSTLLHLNLRECSNLIEFPTDISGLKNLEILILSDCSKLKELPTNIGSMKSLKELLVDNTAIAKLPESIFRLTKLEKIDLNHCQLLRRLPNCIGKLSSLKELSLNDSAIEEIPDSVGSLSNLEILSLMWCGSLTAIPDSVGRLISLTQLLINGSAIKELPISIGSLSYLKGLSVGNCKDLSKLPDSIEGLASLVELQLDRTPITHLPDQVGALKMLRKLEMRNCKDLRFLPESVGSMLALTTLNFVGANISELPESIGMLENLIILRLNKCTQLRKLPSSIGNLKSLHHLWMEETAVTELPESFGMLSSLMILKMAKKPYIELSGNSMPNSTEFPTSFSNLCSLIELNACAWKLCGKIPNDFAKLSSLESLNLGYNNFFSLPSSLTGLFNLKKLLLPYCKELKSLPPLPSNLEEVNVANCTALESVSDLSNLERLQELNLANCEKVVDIRGLECLKSLTKLHMCGCKAFSSMVKSRLSKVCLRNIRTLSMPGSKIPDWFSREVVRFSERKNLKIKGVIICVVVSLDLQIQDDLRDQDPIIAGIEAILVKMNKPLYTIMLELKGVPKTHEDHLYLCRFPDHRPIVSKLKDGYEISIIEHDPPIIKGLKLKKYGIHLVYEDDDDYDGDEESLDESQLSISEKLSKFFSSL